jgi:bifunctional enzyme CysN/CysC
MAAHNNPLSWEGELLRLVTCGSVDDGKSTLIGRLLYDTKQVLSDQLEHIEATSERRGDEHVNLALLTDGLRAEREQGITIDVAYRSFVTAQRRFIVADCPGHVQYTRNMVTGASTADVAIILLDARKGVIEQTRRHSFIASLLRIPHIVACVNKMDLVDFDEGRFKEIAAEVSALENQLDIKDTTVIPIAALHGDNVVDASTNMPWYSGLPLLRHLEELPIATDRDLAHRRFPVQWVIRPISDEHHDYRGYAGRVAGGVWASGDEVVVLPSGQTTRVKSVETHDGALDAAIPEMSITVHLEDDIDVSRGDMLADPASPPVAARTLEAQVCWMIDRPLTAGARLAMKHTTRNARVNVEALVDRMDISTLETIASPSELALNDIGRVRLRTNTPVMVDPYGENRAMGSFILIDEATNETVGAGMVVSAEA